MQSRKYLTKFRFTGTLTILTFLMTFTVIIIKLRAVVVYRQCICFFFIEGIQQTRRLIPRHLKLYIVRLSCCVPYDKIIMMHLQYMDSIDVLVSRKMADSHLDMTMAFKAVLPNCEQRS